MKNRTTIAILLSIFCVMGCVEPFDPPEIASPEAILVVEAVVDSPSGHAQVILSTIRNIASPSSDSLSTRISGAQVNIESGGVQYPLFENTEPGFYETFIPVTESDELILRFTVYGKQYESDPVFVRPTPPIDSITYDAAPDGVTFEVTTHDPLNETRYYQYTFEETIQYRTQFSSDYYYDGETVFQREESIFYCWKSIPSSRILATTTEGLAEDIVFKFPLIFVPGDSWKKEIKYSLLVEQYALSKEAYLYLKELQTNTENLGSLFDPQPGRIEGNIHSSDPDEYVIGYFNARQKQEKRIFVRRQDLPDYPRLPPICNIFDIDSLSIADLEMQTRYIELIGAIQNDFGTIIGYTTVGSRRCLDCRILRGGTNIQPDFWE
jgi:hypothetical protein